MVEQLTCNQSVGGSIPLVGTSGEVAKWLNAADCNSVLYEFDGSNPSLPTIPCGCSSMVELQPSKLTTWVRFPSPAPFYIKKCLNSSAVEQSAVNRSVGGSNPSSSASGRLEKRLTHMPFTHAFTGSNPVRVTIFQTKSERTSFFCLLKEKAF